VRKLALLLVVLTVIWMAACGGGSGSSSSSTVSSVMASCTPSTVYSGQNSQCSATVNGTGNFSTSVTWTANAGSIGSAAVLTVPTVTAPQTVTVTATSTQNGSVSGTATVTVNPPPTGGNVASLIVDDGPAGSGGETNIGYLTATICVHGTNNCQTIDHVQVDTGSEGFRVLSSVLTLTLPQETVGGNPLNECLVFEDGYVWGPVSTADITVSGETASNVPVQVMIPSTSSPPVPNSCSSQNPSGGNGDEGDNVSTFGANAILGVGPFQQDCGLGCTNANSQIPDFYYVCPSSGCSHTYVSLSEQVPNPVTAFATDNNGVAIGFPNVPDGGATNVPGWLIFGIGTESNNGLNGATVYQIPDQGNDAGNFITYFNNTAYPQSFIDSGSNGLFFLDSSVSGVPATCSGFMDASDWYCPSTSPDGLTAQNQGQNNSGSATGSPVSVNFTIENASALFQTSNTAFSTLGGPNSGVFDWGLPFFFGRDVLTAIDTMSTPGGTGPYFAY
jgi:hypothetical protein